MFDFYHGGRPSTAQEEIRYLIAVKRTLPRWANSIPDAEFAALCNILSVQGRRAQGAHRRLVLVETGAGASSLALAYYALKHRGVAYTWDMNSMKGSMIRTACAETFCTFMEASLTRHWQFVGYNTLSPHAGLPVLRELTKHVDFTFHDSTHVLDTILAEVTAVNPYLRDGSVVAVDDAYYDFKHTDTAYINLTRQKLGLRPIGRLPDNRSDPHAVEVERFLRAWWLRVQPLTAAYRAQARSDISVVYFGSELAIRSQLSMRQVKELERRFACWRVNGRRASQQDGVTK